MKISYRGLKKDLPALQKEKFDVKLAKLAKLLDGPSGEREAHVVVTSERHLHNAEITLHYLGHQMVGLGSDADLFLSLCKALDKAGKQVTKQRAKWRGKVRPSRAAAKPTEKAEPGVSDGAAESGLRIYRVNHHERRKPLTVDEALMQMEDGRSYLVYRDADRDAVSVLLRRKDGHFDLVEA
jgi:putative sigma-54 modulation protein